MGLENSSGELRASTFYGNEAAESGGGLYLASGSSPLIENVIVSFSTLGEGLYSADGCNPALACCDIFGNAGGDWVGNIADQNGINGNFSLDPYFCDPENGDFHLWNHTPCVQDGCGRIGAMGMGCWDPQGSEEAQVFTGLRLDRNEPNPFGQGTSIAYRLPSEAGGAGAVLEVFDLAGRLVRTLVNGARVPGDHIVSWDGSDASGERVPSGVYYYQLRLSGQSMTKRMVLLR